MATMISVPGKAPKVSARLWFARLRWQLARTCRLAGWPRLLALVLVLLAVAMLWHRHELAQEALRSEAARQLLQNQRATQQARPQLDPANADLARQLAQFYAALPAHEALPDQLKRLLALADKHGLRLSQADYKALPQANTQLLRYQIILPVKADYPTIARFLQAAMQELPSLSLDSVQFKRPAIDSGEIEARLQLVLFVQNQRSKAKAGTRHE